MSLPATAKDPGQDAYMIRMLACEGSDAKMEVYIPQSAASDNTALKRALAQPVIGYYTLDLTEASNAVPFKRRTRLRSPQGSFADHIAARRCLLMSSLASLTRPV
jgi:hypothetical protein